MSTPMDHVTALLGAWALDACEPDEAAAVTAHVRQCLPCAREAADLRRVAALLTGLTGQDDGAGAGPAVPFPDVPFPDVLGAALARRRPAPSVPPFAASFAAATGLLESALAELDDTAWALPSPVRDWTTGDLVAHVCATDGLFAAAIGIAADPPVDPRTDVVAHSEAVIARHRARPPAHTRETWRNGIDAIAARLRAEPALADRLVQVGDTEMPVADHVVARAFETWIHARDIARAVDLRLPDPAAEHLHVMSDLAARLLDQLSTLDLPGMSGPPAGTVRLALTGPGGGSWLVRVGITDPPGTTGGAGATDLPEAAQPTAEVILDVVEFCLLVGDRRTPRDLDIVMAGNTALGHRLLTLAPALSGP